MPFADLRIAVIIPALNEAPAIGQVIDDIPDWVDRVVVADNGSTDATEQAARDHGAHIVGEPRRGYGSACLAAIAHLRDDPGQPPDIVVFIDGDGSDYPQQMDRLVTPIAAGQADLVIGSRPLGRAERRSMTLTQRAGNVVACRLIQACWRQRFTDLGPFRAVAWNALLDLHMDDPAFGWTVQMQARAARRRLHCAESPVDYRKQVGPSKITGTIPGTLAASRGILGTIGREACRAMLAPRRAFGPDRADTARLAGRISVVVPTINEATHLRDTLSRVTASPNVECIVADGGSTDATCDIARDCGATVVESPRGRATQMNAGAAAATGNVLLFLHADTLLPVGYERHVSHALSLPGVVAGAFVLSFDEPRNASLRLIERATNWRSRALQMPYGDQALFMPTDVFHAVGGYPELPLMEDYQLVRRLRNVGTVATTHTSVVTSARRWRRRGVLRATISNHLTILAFRLGVNLNRLAARRK